MVYCERSFFARQLREFLPAFYSPKQLLTTQWSGEHREYLSGETVWRKKYLYVLRPLLAIRGSSKARPVPIEFGKLWMPRNRPGTFGWPWTNSLPQESRRRTRYGAKNSSYRPFHRE